MQDQPKCVPIGSSKWMCVVSVWIMTYFIADVRASKPGWRPPYR